MLLAGTAHPQARHDTQASTLVLKTPTGKLEGTFIQAVNTTKPTVALIIAGSGQQIEMATTLPCQITH